MFITQKVVEVHGVCGARAYVQTIEIDVIKLQASRVRVDESEGRTRDVFFCDTQRGTDPFYENRFARA